MKVLHYCKKSWLKTCESDVSLVEDHAEEHSLGCISHVVAEMSTNALGMGYDNPFLQKDCLIY